MTNFSEKQLVELFIMIAKSDSLRDLEQAIYDKIRDARETDALAVCGDSCEEPERDAQGRVLVSMRDLDIIREYRAQANMKTLEATMTARRESYR